MHVTAKRTTYFNNKVAYKINVLGLPERVARYNGYLPADLSYADFMDDKDYEGEGGNGGPGGEWATVGFKYDDGGNRIFEKSVTRGAFEYGRLTVPGVGVFERERNTAYDLKRMDLVDGGFRLGLNGDALFPLSDAQGNVRGYVCRSGWMGMHAYYPFGSVYDIHNDAGEDKRRWQSKEFDGEHGKYYFGARYFDPFFALWMSPDPAGQFSNPYTYGGDPLNYVDPDGMWAFGAGLVFGYDFEHGWNVGFGLAAQLGDDGSGPGYNASFTWSADGSWNANAGGSGALPLAGALELNGGLSYSYNSRSGHALSARAGVCAGSSIKACAGAEIGWNLYWNNGSFTGASAYVGLYESALGGLANLSSGYEWGIGSEGRGVYASASVAGATVGLSQNGGFSYGFEEQVYIGSGNNSLDVNGKKIGNMVGFELWLPTLGKYGHFGLGERVDIDAGPNAQTEFLNALFPNSKLDWSPDVDDGHGHLVYSKERPDQITTALKKKGFFVDLVKANTFFNWHEGDKLTFYRSALWGGYGNVEFILYKNQPTESKSAAAYGSYNYGNHWWTHFLVDFLGYKWRSY